MDRIILSDCPETELGQGFGFRTFLGRGKRPVQLDLDERRTDHDAVRGFRGRARGFRGTDPESADQRAGDHQL